MGWTKIYTCILFNQSFKYFFLLFFLLLHCYFFSCYFFSCYFFSYFPTVTFFPVTFFPVTFFPVTFFPLLFFLLLSFLQSYKRASSCAWTRLYAPFDVRSLLCTWTGLMNDRFSFVLCWSVFKKEFLPFNTKTDEREPSHTLTSRAEKTQPFLFWNYRVVTHFPLFPINMVTLMSQ